MAIYLHHFQKKIQNVLTFSSNEIIHFKSNFQNWVFFEITLNKLHKLERHETEKEETCIDV